jgi:hypothetical protein
MIFYIIKTVSKYLPEKNFKDSKEKKKCRGLVPEITIAGLNFLFHKCPAKW